MNNLTFNSRSIVFVLLLLFSLRPGQAMFTEEDSPRPCLKIQPNNTQIKEKETAEIPLCLRATSNPEKAENDKTDITKSLSNNTLESEYNLPDLEAVQRRESFGFYKHLMSNSKNRYIKIGERTFKCPDSLTSISGHVEEIVLATPLFRNIASPQKGCDIGHLPNDLVNFLKEDFPDLNNILGYKVFSYKDPEWLIYSIKYRDNGGNLNIYDIALDTAKGNQSIKDILLRIPNEQYMNKNVRKVIYHPEIRLLSLVEEVGPSLPQKIYLRYPGAQDEPIKILLHDTNSSLKVKDFAPHRFINAPNVFKGPEVLCCLWDPATNQSKSPLMVLVHGGPNDNYGTDFRALPQYWAKKGFFVLAPNYRGSSGYGNKHMESLNGHVGEYDTDDVFSAILHMLKKPEIDAKNLFISGDSHGSSITAHLISNPRYNKLKPAAVSLSCGAYDYAQCFSKMGDEGKENWRGILGGDPYSSHDELNKKISPKFYIENIQEDLPIILFHGMKDENVDPQQALDYLAQLRHFNKKVTGHIFREGNHGFGPGYDEEYIDLLYKFIQANMKHE